MQKFEVSRKLTPVEIAEAFWDLASDEQAQMFEHLHKIAGSHDLTMQSIGIRQVCDGEMCTDIKISHHARDGFQCLTSGAYKYMWGG